MLRQTLIIRAIKSSITRADWNGFWEWKTEGNWSEHNIAIAGRSKQWRRKNSHFIVVNIKVISNLNVLKVDERRRRRRSFQIFLDSRLSKEGTNAQASCSNMSLIEQGLRDCVWERERMRQTHTEAVNDENLDGTQQTQLQTDGKTS